jgi:photosystem II stability/assembly factor-like uncharacterized protein
MTRTHFAALLTLAALAALAASQFKPGRSVGTLSAQERGAAEMGEEENPAARAEWEHLMLRDPVTGRIPEGIRAGEMAFAAKLPRNRSGLLFKSSGMDGYTWSSRGPYNIGGRTRALGIDVTGEDTILAGGVTGGMWRSSDRGRTWTRTTLPTQLPAVSCLAQDTRPGRTATWYYGTGEIIGSSASDGGAYYQGDGIFKSTDNGRSWAQLASTAGHRPQQFDRGSDFVWSVAVDRSNTTQDEVYASYFGVVVRSTDGGTTWKEVLRGAATAGSYAGPYTDVTVTPDGVVYAAIGGDAPQRGIWRSTDGTLNSFKKISPPDFGAGANRIVLGIAPSNPNVVYVLAETPGYGFLGRNFRGDSSWQSLWKYTYVSGDGTGDGGRWENRSANLPAFGGGSGDFFSQGGYDLHVHVKPDDENVLFIGGTNLYRSDDAFASTARTYWIGGYKNFNRDTVVISDYGYANHHPDQHALAFSPTDPRVVYTGSDGGVHRTLDATASVPVWESLDNGYQTSQFYTIAIDHATAGDYTMMGGLQDNGTWMSSSPDATHPWTLRGTSDGAYCAIADGRSVYYVSNQFGYIFRVTVGADGSMLSSTRVDPEGGKGYLFTNPYLLDPANQEMMFLIGGNYLWRNSNLAGIPPSPNRSTSVNWARLDNSRIDDTTLITALAISSASPLHRVYYGTHNGHVFRLDGADQGDPSKIEITGAGFPKNGYVTCVAVDPLDGDRAVVVFSNYNVQSLFLTTDAGETWSAIGGNLEPSASGSGNGPSCRWFTFLHRGGNTIYLVATSTGLYSTQKLNGSATSWALEGAEAIGTTIVDMIDARQSDGFVAVATHGSGVFTTTIQTVGVREPSVAARPSGLLGDPVPNPLRSRSAITVTIPPTMALAPVRLNLYDEEGRLMTTLVEGALEPGEHRVELDRADLRLAGLAGGNYFCRLETPLGVETRRLVIAR